MKWLKIIFFLFCSLVWEYCRPAECVLLALLVRVGGLGITNSCHIAASEYEASTAITEPLVTDSGADAGAP